MTVPQQTVFNGLTMPVFSAFGWAGEDQAIQFALSQLEIFVHRLHAHLPHEIRAQFPYAGLNRAAKVVYLAANEEVEKDLHITFYARPLSFQVALILNNKKLLAKAFKKAEANPRVWYQTLARMDPTWEMNLRQMQITNEETNETAFYQDLFKDNVGNFSLEAAESVLGRAAYLNNEPQWVTPLSLGLRMPSEQVAIMGIKVIRVVTQKLDALMPLVRLLSGQSQKPTAPAAAAPAPKTHLPTSNLPATPLNELATSRALDEFVYISELKPLHIRRGFINLTPEHWPFFALNARTETRPVQVKYGDKLDTKSAVWRLVPSDQARLVVGSGVQLWLEKNFRPNERITIVAQKDPQDDILITLTHTAHEDVKSG